jgi:quercetin dioxygenase-like cupin family protein
VAPGAGPARVDTKGLTARTRFEEVISGPLAEVNGRYKLRVIELVLEPGGHVGEHNHVGPGIRQVTEGRMTYVLPDRTVVYGPGDFFFESGDVNHTVYNRTDAPMVHLLFEILPAELREGPFVDPGAAPLSRRRSAPDEGARARTPWGIRGRRRRRTVARRHACADA